MDWHGCPDPLAYCPPEHCSDPVAHHRIQAQKRAAAAYGSPHQAPIPPSIHFRGAAEGRVTARTLFSNERNAGRPDFDPTRFLRAEGGAAFAESVLIAAQSSTKAKEGCAFLPNILSTNVASSKVPLLKLQKVAAVHDEERATSLSARASTSAFKSETRRGAKTAREQTMGWQPLRNRHVREAKVEPEQLLKTLFPEMHEDLKQLLDSDFIQKLSLVRTAPTLEGDVQQRLKAMMICKGGQVQTADEKEKGRAGAIRSSARPSARDSINHSASTQTSASGSLGQRGNMPGTDCEDMQAPEVPERTLPHEEKSQEKREAQREANVCRPVLPELYLSEPEHDIDTRDREGRGLEAQVVSSRSSQTKPVQQMTPRASQESVNSRNRSERQSSFAFKVEPVTVSRTRRSSNSSKSSQQEKNGNKKARSFENDNLMRSKMERITAELGDYKQKVRDLEIQLRVTSPRKAEEKMHSIEVRLQEQISSLEQQYKLKVETIRAAHRTELADWKASEAESLRIHLEQAYDAKLKVLMEEKDGVERKLGELHKQIQAAEEIASREKASRAPLEQEVVRLRRHCRLIEGRSKALERDLLELQAQAGDLKSAARLLSEQVPTLQPSFSRQASLRSELSESARHLSLASELSEGAQNEASTSTVTLDDRTLSRSNSSRYASIPDDLQMERTLSGTDRRQSASVDPGPAPATHRGSVWQREGGRAGPVEIPADGSMSPHAKRTLLNLSSPSFHLSMELSPVTSEPDVHFGEEEGGIPLDSAGEAAPSWGSVRAQRPGLPSYLFGKGKGDSGRQAVTQSLSFLPKESSGWR